MKKILIMIIVVMLFALLIIFFGAIFAKNPVSCEDYIEKENQLKCESQNVVFGLLSLNGGKCYFDGGLKNEVKD